MKPAVTVLMPVFNAERHLRAAIDSILGQTRADFELLVVDDGSTDGSAAIAAGYDDARIRIERFPVNRGLSAALNHGLRCASATLIARQDADDVSRPDRLETQLAIVTRDPELALVGSQARMLDEQGRAVGVVDRPLDEASVRWYALLDNPFIHTAVMFRRDVAVSFGGFDAAFDPFSQDYALWWRIVRAHRVRNVRQRLVDYRVSPSSIIGRTDAAPAGPYRTRFEAVVRALVSRHLIEAYGDRGLSSDDARLMAGFVLGVDRTDLPRFLATLTRLADWYQRDHPDAAASSDFRATLARQYDAIAARVRSGRRLDSARVYAEALTRRPRLAAMLPWARVLTTVVLGAGGRAALGQWRARLRQA
jgi:glycosyltransferase involved in cell wall biosynthesis